MGLLRALLDGFSTLLTWQTILACVLGGFLGYIVGAIPGLNSANFLAVCLPVLAVAPAVPALAFLAGVYGAAETGSGLPAILFNVPGTPGAGAAAIEGYPLARKGRGAEAVAVAVLVSALGAVMGGILAIIILHYFGRLALAVGPAELFAFGILGIMGTAALASGGNVVRGVFSAALGGLAGLVGSHEIYVLSRATFDIPALYDGFPLVPVVLGMFGVSEALYRMTEPAAAKEEVESIDIADAFRLRVIWKTSVKALRTIASYPRAVVQALITGLTFGMIPGVGVVAASYVSYGYARTFSKTPEEFGKGAMEGLVATECGNNSVVPGALVPLFVLGIPGSVVAALALAVMLIHGLSPGPSFFRNNESMGIAIVLGSMFGVLAAAVTGLLLSSVLAKLTNMPRAVFVTSVMAVCLLGAYSERRVLFDMVVVLIFGVLGWMMKKADWSVAPFLIAFLLVPIAEDGLLHALLIGGVGIFLRRPISLVILGLSVVLLLFPILIEWRRSKRRGRGTSVSQFE